MAYSNDLRTRAVKHFLEQNKDYRKVSALFKIGTGTLFRWVERFQKTGAIERLKPTGRPPLIPPKQFKQLQAFVFRNADDSLTQMAEKWLKNSGQALSISALSRTIARAGLTYKKNLSSLRARYRS
jgi:transposase